MSDPAFGKALRDINFAQRLFPQNRLRQLAALRRIADDQGALVPEAAAPYQTPQVMNWLLSSFEWQRVARGGQLALISAYATIAPTTGDSLVTVSAVSEFNPDTTTAIATLTIPQGQRFGSASPLIDLGVGTWLNPFLTTASGASLISLSITITQGE